MPLSDATLASMRETNEFFSSAVVLGRDIDALTRVYTPDATVMPPGSPVVKGLEAIKTFWHGAITGLDIKEATLTTASVEEAGEGAVEIGEVKLTLASGVLVPAKYVVHWKQLDGAWKWHVDIWNMNE